MGKGFGRIAIMRVPANKRDGAGDVIAFAMADDHLAGPGRAEIINSQIQRGLGLEDSRLQPDRQAGRHIHQGENRARGEDARAGVAHQIFTIGQGKFTPALTMAVILGANQLVMAVFRHHPDQPGGVKFLRLVCHDLRLLNLSSPRNHGC